MIFSLCKNIISFITGLIFLKFIFRTVWIMCVSAMTCFFIMRYFLPTIIADFSQKTAVTIEKKINDKVDHIKQKQSTKRIIKEFNKLKDRVSQ